MTDTPIEQYQGHDVVRDEIKVTNTGDGLTQSMKIEKQEFEFGGRYFVVMETTCIGQGFKPLGDDVDYLVRETKLRAGTALIVDESLVKKLIEEQAARIQKQADEEAGREQLPFSPTESEQLEILAKLKPAQLDELLELQHLGEDELAELVKAFPPKKPRKPRAKKAPATPKVPNLSGQLASVPDLVE